MNNKLLLFILAVLVLSSAVSALGITPGRTTLDYEAGKEVEVSFKVLNTDKKNINLVVLVQGELNQSISVSEVSFTMQANEESRDLSYRLKMPSFLSPGQHGSEVVVVQLPDKSENSDAYIGAALGVATQVVVNVPYPGKYAEAELNIHGPNADGEISFVIPVTSRGDLDLARVRANIDIYTSLNERVDSIISDEISIPSQKRAEIVAKWDSSKAQPGTYRAVATLIYDEETAKLERVFDVGRQVLEIQQIEVNNFRLGDIAKFEMLVENKWSSEITGAYTQMLVYNSEGSVMADFKSQTYDIPALSKALMVSYWDTAGVRKGTYDSSVFLRYGGQSAQHDFELEVSDTNINVIGVGYVISSRGSRLGEGNNSLVIMLGILVGVLILVNLLWFLVLRKKFLKKSLKNTAK